MEFVNALLLGIAGLSTAVSFLFFKLWSFAESRIKELKIDLDNERKENKKLRESTGKDMERIITSSMEVVKSNTSVLYKILNDGK